MQITVKANEQQKQSFLAKGVPTGVEISWLSGDMPIPAADACFDLLFEEEGFAFLTVSDKPVFINAVIEITENLPPNCIRINAWSGFLERDTIEIAIAGLQAGSRQSELPVEAASILDTLGWTYQLAPDVPGMIAARVIAMIVNEAYFALGDGVSTKSSIDTAMKLGTNYPYGPFEWSEKIGLKKIYALLNKLNETDPRYIPAPNLQKEASQNNPVNQ